MNKLIYLGIFTAIISITACHNNDDDNNDPNILNGSFHAVIDGVAWDAEADNVGAVVIVSGGVTTLSISSSSAADTSHFFFTFPYFTNTDTVIANPFASGTVLRFQDYKVGGGVFDANTGTLNVSKSIQDGIETYTGTFNGNFRGVPFDTLNIKVITGGTFTAKRLI